jgi:hypothetical protein
VTLSNSTISVNIPATLLIAGYNLNVLTLGENSIPTTVYVARAATDFLGAISTQVDHFTLAATTTISDPNGVPGTGDESATPLVVTQSLPNMVATPNGGGVTFSQAAPGTIGSVPLGTGGAPLAVEGSVFAQASVAGGLIKANFDCFPGTTIIDPPGGTSGTTFTPASPEPFVVLSLTGATPPPPPPPPAAVPLSSVQGAQVTRSAELPRTGLELFGPVAVAIGLLDLGYLAQSAVRPGRRRRPSGEPG